MKRLTVGLGLVVALLTVALVYKHLEMSALESELSALKHERELTNGEIRQLNARITEMLNRQAAAAATVAEATRAAAAATESARRVEDASKPVPPAPKPGVTTTAPAGWGKNGARPDMYVAGVDSNVTWGGMPSAYVESLAPTVEKGFGGMMQTAAADDYVGKRVRLSGWIKTENANEGGGHLWLRIDGQEKGQMLGFDNMGNRAAKGTTDWQEASVVLDVPAGSRALAYGFFVSGGGKMWVNGQRIEEVGPDVPTTNMLKPKPQNLGFDPTRKNE